MTYRDYADHTVRNTLIGCGCLSAVVIGAMFLCGAGLLLSPPKRHTKAPWAPAPHAAALAAIWHNPSGSGSTDLGCKKFTCRDYSVAGFNQVGWVNSARKPSARRLLAHDPASERCDVFDYAPNYTLIGDEYLGEPRKRLRGGPLDGVVFVRTPLLIGPGCQVLLMTEDWPQYFNG